MKTLRLILAAFISTLTLTGCLQVERLVKLKPDGSGTVEETMTMSKATVAQMGQMMGGFGDLGGGAPKADAPAKKGFDVMDEKKLKDEAAKMGEGVTFVSAKKIDNDKSEGYVATFAFADINNLKLDQNPGSAMPGPDAAKKAGGAVKAKTEPVTFKFTKGNPAELTIAMPKFDPTAKKPKEAANGMEDMAMQMMQQVFKDMRMSMAVEVAGTISETNAEYRNGSRVTLMEMDFNKLLADPEKFKKLAKENPQTMQESKALMKQVDGVKIEAAPEVKIKFK
jgi:hypothetical protein